MRERSGVDALAGCSGRHGGLGSHGHLRIYVYMLGVCMYGYYAALLSCSIIVVGYILFSHGPRNNKVMHGTLVMYQI